MESLSAVIRRAGSFFPSRLAVIDGQTRLTYEQLENRSACLARALMESGLSAGDRVAILDANSFRYLETNYACALAGLVLVPLNIRLATREIAHILSATDCKILLASSRFQDRLDDLSDDVLANCKVITWDENDGIRGNNSYERFLGDRPLIGLSNSQRDSNVSQIYFTSGTTGQPKGVCLTAGNLMASALDAIISLDLSADDVWLHAAPMFHLVDAFAIWSVSLVGATHVIARFDPQTLTSILCSERITKTSLPPTLINMMVAMPDASCAGNNLKIISHGGSPMSPSLHARASAFFGCALLQAYGTTETSGITCQQFASDSSGLDGISLERVRQSVGRPTPNVLLKFVDDDGTEVPHGKIGELAIKGTRVMAGYWNDPDATAAAVRDGWYFSGDLGYRDPDGLCHIVDRKKDMVITGGENVYPAEVEAALLAHPAVLEAAVFGVANETWGEQVQAVVVLQSGAVCDEQTLIAHCRQLIGNYKVPKAVAISPDPLPKSGPGKIAKHLLRAAFKKGGDGKPNQP